MKPSESRRTGMVISVRGRFAVRRADGLDLTPANRKERAILAMLALSPDRRQSRRWIESLLWSESPAEKASANLRRALANLRAAFPAGCDLLETSRNEVWLGETVRVDSAPRGINGGELLDLVDAPDPAFDDWLRDLRTADAATQAQTAPTSAGVFDSQNVGGGTVIVIRANAATHDTPNKMYQAILTDILAARLEAEGANEVYAGVEPDETRLNKAATIIHLELVSMVEGDEWIIHLRALADRERRFLWSGRLRLPCDSLRLTDGVDLPAFVSRALTQIQLRYHAFRSAGKSPLMVLQRAATMLYDGQRVRIDQADADLSDLCSGDMAPVALAWRGFAQIARRLEFGVQSGQFDAEELVHDALSRQPGNALIAALASRVALDVTGDMDKAEYFATASLLSDDRNPYSLQAGARIALMHRRVREAAAMARMARQAAEGLQHSFAWDFELCLTALAENDIPAALDAARTAHRNNPWHRASLRYLVATSLLAGETEEARRAAECLARIEPGFRLSDLQRSDYPVLTLRRFGLVEHLSGLTPG